MPRCVPQAVCLVALCAIALQAEAKNRSKEVAALFDAIRKGDAATVRRLVTRDESLVKARNEKRWDKPTTLHAALRSDETRKVLLSLGADPNARDGRGQPVMHRLRYLKTPAPMDQLIKAGGDINARDKFGCTLLHYAVSDHRQHKAARWAIERGADVNAASNLGLTPLHVLPAKWLIDAGADVNARDWRGRTPLFFAGATVTPLLLKKGAKLNVADYRGWTPLHQAALRGDAGQVALLLKSGVAVNATDDEGWTSLHVAVRHDRKRVAPALLASGADPNLPNRRGWTPLTEARLRGRKAILDLLGAHKGRPAPVKNPARLTPPSMPADKVRLGKLTPERPTLICLGFKWSISGDANRNASCAVAYRKKGVARWTDFFPGLRLGGEVTGSGYTTPHMFAGSVLDLKPGTAYEIKLTVTDPDGVEGRAERVLSLQTRSEPRPFAAGRKLHVYAKEHKGARQQPAFGDIQSAYDQSKPGDTILVHAGNHHKDLIINRKATPDRPITIRGAGDGEARIQGQGNDIVNLDGSAHHIFEDLTLYDADHAFLARGETIGFTARRCKIVQCKRAFFAISNRNKDFLVTDCDMTGPVGDWHPRIAGKSQGVWLGGQGHVVQFCRIAKYWDGLSITGGVDKDPGRRNCAIDFYNNRLAEFRDDAIEMDYGVHNIRVFRNLIRNTFMGISTQPLQGGPGYIFRNVVYATTRSPLKLNQKPAGLFIFHNTLIGGRGAGSLSKGFQNSLVHNNLFVGKQGEWTIAGGTSTVSTDVDFNGHRFYPHPRKPKRGWRIHWSRCHPWFKPAGAGISSEGTARDLAGFARITPGRLERHGITVDYDAFVKCPPPSPAENQHDESPIDLRLRTGSRAMDMGKPLPYFSDGSTGKAPDLGAYELGAAVPHYGPRK